MQEQKSDFTRSLEETLSEVTESNNIHIKVVGRILLDNGINNVKNINEMSTVLRDKGINIIKG